MGDIFKMYFITNSLQIYFVLPPTFNFIQSISNTTKIQALQTTRNVTHDQRFFCTEFQTNQEIIMKNAKHCTDTYRLSMYQGSSDSNAVW